VRVTKAHHGRVVVSSSYGDYFNAYNASCLLVRGLVMNDAGWGKDDAGNRAADSEMRVVVGFENPGQDHRICELVPRQHGIHVTTYRVNELSVSVRTLVPPIKFPIERRRVIAKTVNIALANCSSVIASTSLDGRDWCCSW
jgi:hypothetical protein